MDAGFRRYAEDCPDAVIVTDRAGRIEYVNAACERVTGYARGELVGRTPALLKSGSHETDFYRGLWSALLAGGEFCGVVVNRLEGGFVSFGRDVTERARELEKLAHAATHDSLTDLPNRSLFLDRLGQALRQAQRRREPFTVAILDIDRFRDSNNLYGHLAGDAVLQAVAARVLQKIVVANAAPVPFEARKLPVSVSIGACTYPEAGATERELRTRADLRMFEAKRAGGSRYVL